MLKRADVHKVLEQRMGFHVLRDVRERVKRTQDSAGNVREEFKEVSGCLRVTCDVVNQRGERASELLSHRRKLRSDSLQNTCERLSDSLNRSLNRRVLECLDERVSPHLERTCD